MNLTISNKSQNSKVQLLLFSSKVEVFSLHSQLSSQETSCTTLQCRERGQNTSVKPLRYWFSLDLWSPVGNEFKVEIDGWLTDTKR